MHEGLEDRPGPSPQGKEDAAVKPAVLLVDDERAFADALAFRLETRGIPCLVAYRGEEALKNLERSELEVVLLDLNMPGMHGLEALREIKTRRADIEVILLTGEADFAVAATGMRRGAGDYLIKPVHFEALLTALEKARGRSRIHKERLRAAQAGKLMALGAFAAGVGHEINNPLQIILQRSEWLCELLEETPDTVRDKAELEKTARIIQEQAARAGRITAQLLELAHRSRSGGVITDTAGLISKVAARFQDTADQLGVELCLSLPDALPAAACSPAELDPVLSHLFKNALDSIEARLQAAKDIAPDFGPKLSVGAFVDEDKNSLLITIEDNGEGVSPETAAHMYDPFFSTRPVGKGTGLGLTICHSIITELRGSINFTPVQPQGARFIIGIPLRDRNPES